MSQLLWGGVRIVVLTFLRMSQLLLALWEGKGGVRNNPFRDHTGGYDDNI